MVHLPRTRCLLSNRIGRFASGLWPGLAKVRPRAFGKVTSTSPGLGSFCVVAFCLLGIGSFACSEPQQGLKGDDVILAKVEGSPISEFDVERALEKSLGRFAVASVKRAAEPKTLESLIQSRALAALGEREIDALGRLAVEKETAAYRESLLVKSYLAKHAPPAPVTEEQLRAYYQTHPERFGALPEKRYEVLFGTESLTAMERPHVMKKMGELAREPDWKVAVEKAKADGVSLAVTSGTLSEPALHPDLKGLLSPLGEGQLSGLVVVQGRAYIGRITGIRTSQPRAFADVREEIERTLTTVSLRDALARVGAEAVAQVKVERIKQEPSVAKEER
jgi:PPIC-type PPIASE domain